MSGGKGNSRANTSSNATNTQTTTNNVDNSVHTSDMGAIAAAFEHGQAALDLGRDSLDTAANFAGRAGDQAGAVASQSLANSRDALRDSLDFGDAVLQRFAEFGDTALASYEGISSDALNRVTESSRGAFDFARDLFGAANDATSRLAADNLSGLTSLAQQTSASSDDRVTKIALYALVAVAAVFILPRIFGKGGA